MPPGSHRRHGRRSAVPIRAVVPFGGDIRITRAKMLTPLLHRKKRDNFTNNLSQAKGARLHPDRRRKRGLQLPASPACKRLQLYLNQKLTRGRCAVAYLKIWISNPRPHTSARRPPLPSLDVPSRTAPINQMADQQLDKTALCENTTVAELWERPNPLRESKRPRRNGWDSIPLDFSPGTVDGNPPHNKTSGRSRSRS